LKQNELTKPYKMPAYRDPSSELVYNSGSQLFGSDKYGGTRDVILSPEEKARLIALKKADVISRRPLFSSNPQAISSQISKIGAAAQVDKSMQTFLQTGVVDKTMIEGFSEMGRAVALTEWASIQNRFGLTDAQLNSLKAAHANYFGLALTSPAPPRNDVTALPMTEPGKKPNILLLLGVAVVGLLVIRKVLN